MFGSIPSGHGKLNQARSFSHQFIQAFRCQFQSIDQELKAQQAEIKSQNEQIKSLNTRLEEAYKEGVLGENALGTGVTVHCTVHRGAGAYICGEETALIESLEGRPGRPRFKPPFPAVEGAFRKPTVVNNIETLACVTHIVGRGADWFTGIGTEGSTRFSYRDWVENKKAVVHSHTFSAYPFSIERTVHHFLNGCVREGAPPLSSLDDALMAQRIIEGCETSVAEQRIVEL